MDEIIFTEASLSDSLAINQTFRHTVLNTPNSAYSESQLEAWASNKPYSKWEKAIEEQYFIKATQSNRIIGFASLTEEGLIDYLFVHPDFQGKGIAKRLYNKLEKQAKKHKMKHLSSFASHKARLFFESNGFECQRKNKVMIGAVELENWLMVKRLEST